MTKRKAKFRVRQVVVTRHDNEPARVLRIYKVKENYQYEYLLTGWRFAQAEPSLRALTAREIGPRRKESGKILRSCRGTSR